MCNIGMAKRAMRSEEANNADLEKEWSEIFEAADKKNLRISEKEVYGEIQAHRAAKKKKVL